MDWLVVRWARWSFRHCTVRRLILLLPAKTGHCLRVSDRWGCWQACCVAVLGAPPTSKDRLLTSAGKTLRVTAGTKCSAPASLSLGGSCPKPTPSFHPYPTSLTILLTAQHLVCVRAGSLFPPKEKTKLYSCTMSVPAFTCFSFVLSSHCLVGWLVGWLGMWGKSLLPWHELNEATECSYRGSV